MKSTFTAFIGALGLAAVLTNVMLGADAVKLEPNSTLRFEFPDLPDTLETMKSGKSEPARMVARLPANYSRDSKFPLCVFLNGGSGGRGDSLPFDHRVIGSNDFIEGGFGPLAANFLGSRNMKPFRFLLLRGDRLPKEPKNVARFQAFELLGRSLGYTAQEQDLDFTYVVMRGLGHELRQPYDTLIGSWLRGEKLPDIE